MPVAAVVGSTPVSAEQERAGFVLVAAVHVVVLALALLGLEWKWGRESLQLVAKQTRPPTADEQAKKRGRKEEGGKGRGDQREEEEGAWQQGQGG